MTKLTKMDRMVMVEVNKAVERSKILNYFIKQRIKTLTESIGEF